MSAGSSATESSFFGGACGMAGGAWANPAAGAKAGHSMARLIVKRIHRRMTDAANCAGPDRGDME